MKRSRLPGRPMPVFVFNVSVTDFGPPYCAGAVPLLKNGKPAMKLIMFGVGQTRRSALRKMGDAINAYVTVIARKQRR